MQIRQQICQQVMLLCSTLSCAIPHNGMSCAKIHNVHTMVMSSFSADTLSEEKCDLWDECGEHLEAKQQRHDSKNR